MTTNRTRKQMQKIALAVLFAAAGMFVAWPAGAVVNPGAKFAGGNLTLEAKNATVGEILGAVRKQWPEVGEEILASPDRLVVGVSVFVGEADARRRGGLSAQVAPEDEVYVVVPLMVGP